MIVNVHAAKTTLSKLIERAENGEEVIIARAGKPAVRLTPVAPMAPQEYGGWIGSLQGQGYNVLEDFETDQQLIDLFENGPIFPDDDRET
jgi:prevent-host-death family protein